MKWILVAAIGVVPTVVCAADYAFAPIFATKQGKVVLALKSGKTATEFWMPAWAPGDYQIFNYGAKVAAIKFTRGGEEVEYRKETDPNRWTIPGGADRVEYVVNQSRGNFSENLRVQDTEFFISGPGVLGWFTGHQAEPHTVSLTGLPAGFVTQTPLKNESTAATGPVYSAPDYDVLLDSPIVSGTNVRSHRFAVRNIPHDIVFFGRKSDADPTKFAELGQKIIEANVAMFGRLPYPHYQFLFDFGGFPAGLEHATSARMGAWSNDPQGMTGLISHEFFHAYNVKVIRPKVLGPFDYTKPAITGTLWWLEGVTDYYATVMEVRAGLTNRQAALRGLGQDYVGFMRRPARLRVSADEASRRVWENRGSQGFGGLSYYEKGRLIGFVLDMAIRLESQNKHSLDDVIRTLFDECRDGKPGYEEGRIRELCVKFGGAELGPIYDRCVLTTEELPLSDLARRMGATWEGTNLIDDPLAKNPIGQSWPMPVGK